MISTPDTLPNDRDSLKQMLLQMQSQLALLQEENALIRQRLFGRNSEQSVDPRSPQLAMFNVAESLDGEVREEEDKETGVPGPIKKHGKRKPLTAKLPRVVVIHELSCPNTN